MEPLSSVDISKTPIPIPRKKPVPLPRSVNKENHGSGGDKEGQSKTEPCEVGECQNIGLTPNREADKPRPTSSVSVTKLPEKSKAVIEGKRAVTSLLEKSMRTIGRGLNERRRSKPTLSTSSSKEDESQISNLKRNISFPSQDIELFESITFQSPLTSNSSEIELGIGPDEFCDKVFENTSSDGSSSSLPPPLYPPPPLPDESVYDEVQSVISNNSSSLNSYDQNYCSNSVYGSNDDNESYYEDVSLTRIQNVSLQHSTSVGAHIARSDSWSLHKPEILEDRSISSCGDVFRTSLPSLHDDLTLSNTNHYEQDSTFAAFTRGSRLSQTSESVSLALDDLEEQSFGSGDDDPFSPSVLDDISSCSVRNDLYVNWDLPTPSLFQDKSVGKREETCKSVIIQFDPLYEKECSVNRPISDVNNPELTDTVTTLKQAVSPYGKINKVVYSDDKSLTATGSENKGTNIPPPPAVPPRNYERIAPIGAVNKHVAATSVPKATTICDTKNNPMPSATSVSDSSTGVTKLSDFEHKPSTGTTSKREQLVPEEDSIPFKGRMSGLNRVNSLFKKMKSVADVSLRSTTKFSDDSSVQAIDRPILSPQLTVYCSELYKVTVNEIGLRKDFVKRYGMLAEGKLSFYTEKTCSDIREVFTLDTILSVQLILEQKVSSDGSTMHCFEVTTSGKGRKLSQHLLGSSSSAERKVWMQKILESLTTVFPTRISCDFERAGWCFIREGISGTWTGAWILLTKRTLLYCLNNGSIQEIDLRKARCVELQDSGPNSPKVAEKGQIILVDFPGQSVYLQADYCRETITWRYVIKAASVDNGPNLSQQQLTHDDIPAIVDKCISFVYAHGSLSEGIYRRSGSNSNIERLLKQFRQDAWSVQLSRQEYTEYEIASTLKRFFRDLPESLFTTELHSELCEIADGKFGNDKLLLYRKALEKLPPINFLTSRKLLGHLHFIHEQHEKNLMPVDNLASIWGPTLLRSENSDALNWSKAESTVVADLILLYPSLFDVDVTELSREKRILETLERIHASNSNICPNKPSGDLKVWVYLATRDSKNCVHVSIGPQKRAEEVCAELSTKMSLPPHELCLEEVVLGGALLRTLHHTEHVLDTVLRWGYWDEASRKNNCLVLRKNTTFTEVTPVAKPPFTYSGELRFADRKTKAFKSHIFEFSQAKLCYYKDKSVSHSTGPIQIEMASHKIGEWKIEDIVWYVGHEPKRNPQMRWSITFIDRRNYKQRSKENPFFGCTIAGTTKDEQLKWMAAMLMGEYPQGLLPPATLIQ